MLLGLLEGMSLTSRYQRRRASASFTRALDLAAISSGGDGGEMREVKAQAVRLDKGARLMDMVAENRAQRRLEQMGGAVGAADGLAAAASST